MYWLWLFAAGMLEIIFIVLLRLSDGMTRLWPTAGFLFASIPSFLMLTKAMQGIPMGTAYAVWTGMGAIGAMVAGIILFGEAVNGLRLFFFVILLVGIAGLKLTSPTA